MNERNQKDGDAEGKSLAELCVQRRKEVRRKKTLSSTAKLLFDDLTDLAFLNKFAVEFGVVRIGKPFLAQHLGCSVPTITRAQAELSPGELWTRTAWYEGHEITIWFLRGVASGQMEFDQFTEGATRPAARIKVAPRVQKLVRNGHGHFCKEADPADLLENQQAPAELTVHSRQSCREAPVIPAGATPSNLTGVNRQTRPSGPGRNDGGLTAGLTGANGHSCGGGPVKVDAGTPSGLTVYKDTDALDGEREAPAPPQAVTKKPEIETGGDDLADFRATVKDSLPSRLEKLEATLVREKKLATTATDKAFAERKLMIVRQRVNPLPPADPAAPIPQGKPKPTTTATRKLPTEAENLAAGRVAVAKGFMLTQGMRAALTNAGELPKNFPTARVPAGV